MTLLYGKITKNENEPEIEKVKEFIEVPYKLKDTIKSKGAIWNKDKKAGSYMKIMRIKKKFIIC